MIRKMHETELESILDIWLTSNLEAHPFVAKEYWYENLAQVKSDLPKATIYVATDVKDQPLGFIGVMDNYIAGIFVKSTARSQGVGHKLIAQAKENSTMLTLNVYQKNARAVAFYQHEDFKIIKTEFDKTVKEKEYLMRWTSNEAVDFK